MFKSLFGYPVDSSKFSLEPVGLIKTKMFSEFPVDWIVWQKFECNGETIFVRGFGRTREEAKNNFYQELEELKNE